MAVIAVKPKDEQTYQDFKRHIRQIVDAYGSCEMTAEAFRHGTALESVEMGFAEMQAHISSVLNGEPRRVLPNGPRNDQEFLEQMAREINCKLSRPVTRPWNVLFEDLDVEDTRAAVKG